MTLSSTIAEVLLGENDLRRQVVQIARRLDTLGLNRGTSGNVSVRNGDAFLVTPSGVPVEDLAPEAIVAMDFGGAVLGTGKPSSEWRFHCDILKCRPETGAVIHTHSRFATVMACVQREIPPFHYMIAMAGGETIRCTPYAIFGSQELSDLALKALEGRKACLLGNHGMIALGRDLPEALAITIEVESLGEQYVSAHQNGEPNINSGAQIQAVI